MIRVCTNSAIKSFICRTARSIAWKTSRRGKAPLRRSLKVNAMSKILRNVTLPALALALSTVALYHLLYAEQELPPLNPPSSPPAVLNPNAIAGVGIVEASSENINVGSAQTGVVLEVY